MFTLKLEIHEKITCLALFWRFPWPAIGGSCLALPSKTCFEELNRCLSLITEQGYPFSFICLSKAVILFSRLSGSKLSHCSFSSRRKSARAVCCGRQARKNCLGHFEKYSYIALGVHASCRPYMALIFLHDLHVNA